MISKFLNDSDQQRHARVDSSTHAQVMIDSQHHEIHVGDHYNLIRYAVLPINNVYDVQFTTPNTTKWIHLAWVMSTTDVCTFHIYEGAEILLAGTSITPMNNNRNSVNESAVVAAYHLNTSLANANLDTAVAGATLLAEGKLGSNQLKGVTDRQDSEWVLKANTVYCFRAVAVAATDIFFRMRWYEHTDKE